MLANLLKEHQARQQLRKEVQEKRRADAVAAANVLTHTLVDQLNVRVSLAYSNQKRLDSEAKRLQHYAGQLAKHTGQWLQLIDNFNTAIKEIGDVENWAKTIEADMVTISSALDMAYKATQEHGSGKPQSSDNPPSATPGS